MEEDRFYMDAVETAAGRVYNIVLKSDGSVWAVVYEECAAVVCCAALNKSY